MKRKTGREPSMRDEKTVQAKETKARRKREFLICRLTKKTESETKG